MTYPRVTYILQATGVIDTRWYNEAGRNRGTDIHLLTTYIDDGLIKEEDIADSEYKDYLQAYFDFLHDNKIEVIETEKEVKKDGEHPYVGHLDRIYKVNGIWYLADIKTGQIQKWNGIQLTAYANAYGKVVQKAILKLQKNGKYKFITGIDGVKLTDPSWGLEWHKILWKYYEGLK